MAQTNSKKTPFAHRRHSFRLLPHAHTHYPALLILVVFCAFYTFVWTSLAHGDSYSVRGKVPAPPLTQAATITDPTDGELFGIGKITVTGTCPDKSYVAVMRNQSFSGAALCQNNSWSLPISLFDGSNQLIAQDYNLTDDPGPATPIINVTYDPTIPTPKSGQPTPVSQTPSSPSAGTAAPMPAKTAAGASAPLILTTNFSYRGAFVGQQTNWQLQLSGGTGPYQITSDWGDGESGVTTQAADGAVKLTHTYAQPGSNYNSYTVNFTVRDAKGMTTSLQSFIIITPQPKVVGAANGVLTGSPFAPPSSSAYQRFQRIAAPLYAITVLTIAVFWLGSHTAATAAVAVHPTRVHHGKGRR